MRPGARHGGILAPPYRKCGPSTLHPCHGTVSPLSRQTGTIVSETWYEKDPDHGPPGRRQDHVVQAACAPSQCGAFQCRRRARQRQQGSRIFRAGPHRARPPHGMAVRPSGEGRLLCDCRLHLSHARHPRSVHERRQRLCDLGRPHPGRRFRGHQSDVRSARTLRSPGHAQKDRRNTGRNRQ